MDEQRKYAIPFSATILAARKLNESGSTPWAIHVAIIDAIEKASRILEKIDEQRQTDKIAGDLIGPVSASRVRRYLIFS